MHEHPARVLSGVAALASLAAAAFMYQVPFTSDFEIVTKRLCSDSLQASLFKDPAGGTSWCWRDGQNVEHASFIVTDQKWHRLVYWQNDREYIKAFGGYGSSAGQFHRPKDVSQDGFGRVFVADEGNSRIVRLNYDFDSHTLSHVSQVSMLDTYRLVSPEGVCIDDNGTKSDSSDDYLWIADPGRPAVYRMQISDGTLAARFTDFEDQPGAWLDCPVSVAAGQEQGANNGTVYVADRSLQRVILLEDSAGQLLWRASRKLPDRTPMHVCTDWHGYVFVTDGRNGDVIRLGSDLASMLVDHSAASNPRSFTVPRNTQQGLLVDEWSDSTGLTSYGITGGLTSVSLIDTMFDATRESLGVHFELESPAYVTVSVDGGSFVIDHVYYDQGGHSVFWLGRQYDSTLYLPGRCRVSVDAWGAGDLIWHDVKSVWGRVKGTVTPGVISTNSTWDTLHDPYVVSGHSLSISDDATLTIQPGVRVMFTEDSTKRGITVHEGCRIEANATAQNPVYFMPHRKMNEAYDPAQRGLWGGIHFNWHSYGALFNHCVFENGGGAGWDNGVIYTSTPDPGSILDFDNCHFLGSAGSALTVEDDNARDRVDFDTCRFEYCADYPIFKVKAMYVADICATCTFANNDVAGLMVHTTDVTGERITASCTWPCMSPGWHYDLDGDLQVWGNAGGYPTLTVSAGASIRMPTNGEIRIGNSGGAMNYSGAIVAAGTPGAPVVFEGLNDAAWDGVWLDWDPGNSSAFRYSTFMDGVGYSRKNSGGVGYYPMLYCKNASPVVYRCKFLNGYRSNGAERGTGLYLSKVRSRVSQSKFLKNECGILADFVGVSACTTYNCVIDSGEYGVFVLDLSSSNAYVRNTNVYGNTVGVCNLNATNWVNANGNWWGPNNGGGPGNGNNGTQGNVIASSWSSTPFAVWDMDAEAVTIVTPTGRHNPGTVEPRAVVRNYLDTTVTFTTTLGIGTVYRQTVSETLAASAIDTVVFPQATLDSGWYNLGLAVDLAGDEDPTNDSVSDTVWVRDSVDAAALAVLAPPAQITVDDTIEPRVRIANYGTLARRIPVGFYLDSTHIATESLVVAAHETAEVSFDLRTFPPGSHQVRYVCCLPLDDNRHNDTVSVAVNVAAGDYWVAEDSPPYASARMCWDQGRYIYAAERGGTGVRRYDVLDDEWAAVASPAVQAVFGIASLKGQVYALGQGANSLQLTANSPADEGRRQKAECRRQNGGLADGANSLRLTANSSGTDVGRGQEGNDGQGLARTDTDGQGPGIYRYVADGDSWVLVTTCDTTLALGTGSALVGDDAGGLYLIEGGSKRVLRYLMAADSWVSSTATYTINQWGAAAWGRGKLYVLADSTHVQYLNPANAQWGSIDVALPDVGYGTALCADPTADKLFAFVHRPPWGTQASPFRERWLRNPLTQSWGPKASLADTTGATLCFGSTQSFCLDGKGGFWRYRPTPAQDAAAIGIPLPDTLPRDSSFTPVGIVHNGWQDTLQFRVHLRVDTYGDSVQAVIAPQSWDTVAFAPISRTPGQYPLSLRVGYGDSYVYNDTAFDTLTIRYRKDVAALLVLSPQREIPWTSLVHPSGVVTNNANESLGIWAKMVIGTGYVDSVQVTLAPQALDTVEFDTCHLRVGQDTAVLSVRCTGDEIPGNDNAYGPFEVLDGDYWVTLASPPYVAARMVDGPDEDVYTASANTTGYSRYDIEPDSWYSRAASPLSAQKAVCRHGGKVFAVGLLGSFLDGGTRPAVGPTESNTLRLSPQNGTDGPPAIVAYDVSANTWDTLTMQIPINATSGCCLFAADDTTLYLLGAGTYNFQRYSVTQNTWAPVATMPNSVYQWTSGCADGAGRFYVLTGSDGTLLSYDVSEDTWLILAKLNRVTPTGSALACDPGKDALYALWADDGNGFYGYDVNGNIWQPLEPYPGELVHPALAGQGGAVYGQNGKDSSSSFACYSPEPGLDVATLSMLAPTDTERYDSAVTPTGVFENLSSVPVWCIGLLTCGNVSAQFPAIYLAPGQTDTLTADPVYLPAGWQTATLQVTCVGDSNPANNACTTQVLVQAPWEPRQAPMFAPGRLDADQDGNVYAAAQTTNKVMRYSIAGDTWHDLPTSPFAAGTFDLSYYDGALYALGNVASGLLGSAGHSTREGLPPTDAGPAIYRLGLSDSAWTLVTDTIPAMGVAGGSWIAATGQGIYYEPGWGRAFFRHDSAGWAARCSLPVSLCTPTAMNWDRDDTIFLTGEIPDTVGTTQVMLGYSLGQDAWTTLEPVPVDSTPGLALAAQPDSGIVLALVSRGTSNAALYAYDRSAGAWTEEASPGWALASGAALTFGGTEAWTLAGGGTSTIRFWCFDPGFAAYWGAMQDGVAGKLLPVMRWQLTCAPNPVTAKATVRWQVPRMTRVSLRIYNTAGQLVKTLAQGEANPGTYTAQWNGADSKGRRVAAGVYLVKLTSDGYAATHKLVVQR